VSIPREVVELSADEYEALRSLVQPMRDIWRVRDDIAPDGRPGFQVRLKDNGSPGAIYVKATLIGRHGGGDPVTKFFAVVFPAYGLVPDGTTEAYKVGSPMGATGDAICDAITLVGNTVFVQDSIGGVQAFPWARAIRAWMAKS